MQGREGAKGRGRGSGEEDVADVDIRSLRRRL